MARFVGMWADLYISSLASRKVSKNCKSLSQMVAKSMVVKTGHETAKVGSFTATYFLVKLVAMKLPRSAVSWPLLIGAEKRP